MIESNKGQFITGSVLCPIILKLFGLIMTQNVYELKLIRAKESNWLAQSLVKRE